MCQKASICPCWSQVDHANTNRKSDGEQLTHHYSLIRSSDFKIGWCVEMRLKMFPTQVSAVSVLPYLSCFTSNLSFCLCAGYHTRWNHYFISRIGLLDVFSTLQQPSKTSFADLPMSPWTFFTIQYFKNLLKTGRLRSLEMSVAFRNLVFITTDSSHMFTVLTKKQKLIWILKPFKSSFISCGQWHEWIFKEHVV